jgi:small subunit ribosomal protein S4
MVSHGHILVNGKRMTVPSHKVKVDDVISVREGSRQSIIFTNLAENFEAASVPAWLSFDIKKLEGKTTGVPTFTPAENLFDPEQVFEYYSR